MRNLEISKLLLLLTVSAYTRRHTHKLSALLVPSSLPSLGPAEMSRSPLAIPSRVRLFWESDLVAMWIPSTSTLNIYKRAKTGAFWGACLAEILSLCRRQSADCLDQNGSEMAGGSLSLTHTHREREREKSRENRGMADGDGLEHLIDVRQRNATYHLHVARHI